MRDRSKSGKDLRHLGNDRTEVNKGSLAPYWESSGSKSLRLKIDRVVPAFLSDSQAVKELLLDLRMLASIRRAEELPRLISTIGKARTWKGFVPVPGGLPCGSCSSFG